MIYYANILALYTIKFHWIPAGVYPALDAGRGWHKKAAAGANAGHLFY